MRRRARPGRDVLIVVDHPGDGQIVRILQATRTIAIVGASPKRSRDSHRVMRYLQLNGYRTIPVNPTVAGDTILGETVYGTLDEIPANYELVDVFRRPAALPAVVDEVLAARDGHGIRFLWLQVGVVHEEAAAKARKAGLEVVMDRCLKIEFGRLLSHG